MKKLLLAAAAATAALSCAPVFAQMYSESGSTNASHASRMGTGSQGAVEPYFPNTYLVAQTGSGADGATIARPQGLTPQLLDEAARSQSPAYVVYSSPRTGNLSLDDVFFGQ